MPQLGVAEILVIVIIALVLFGPNRLPELGRQVAKGLRELRQVQEHLKGELDDVMDQFDVHGAGAGAEATTAAHPEDSVDHDEGGDGQGVDIDEVEFPGGPPAATPAPPASPGRPAATPPGAAPSRFRAPRPPDGGTGAAPAPSRFRAPGPTA